MRHSKLRGEIPRKKYALARKGRIAREMKEILECKK